MKKNMKIGRTKMNRANVTSIGEVYKLRKVLERIEKKLDKFLANDTKGI